MKKRIILSLVLVLTIVVVSGKNFYAININDQEDIKNRFDIASSELTLENSPNLYYVVYGFTSLDFNVPCEFKDSNQYIENYSIEFIYPDNTIKQKSFSAPIIQSGTIDIMNTKSITIPTEKISKVGTKEIEIPLMTESNKQKIYNLSKEGIKSVLRNVSINVFYLSPNNQAYCNTLLKKSEVLSGIETKGSDRQDFKYMYASIYATDEYQGTKKRQSFSSYHSKFDSLNQLPNGIRYVNTTLKDSRPDVISLGWGFGGAIPMNDSSIRFEGQYSLQCETCQIAGRTKYGKNTFYNTSSGISKHESVFTGQSIGYNIPDVGKGQCSYCGASLATRPGSLNIAAKSGWYNKGSYNGASGTARSEYYHTYSNKTLNITPSVSSLRISFSANLVLNEQCEKTWVYTTISPN